MATQLDLYFPSINATVIGANSLSISIGTTVEIGSAPDGGWFMNNDAVLQVTGTTIQALTEGSSTIMFIKNNAIVGSFDVNVTPDQAASLGLKADIPVIK